MINYIRYLLMAFSLLGGWSSIMAQSPIDRRVIGASGGSATAGSGASAVDISFTVGETSIGNFNANGSLLTVGFQQPDVVNTAPTTTGIPNQTATVGQLLSLNIAPSFSDAETPNALQLSALGLPTGLALVGGVISGTPTAVSAASVTVVATDPGSLSVGATFTLTVSTSAVVPTGPAMLTITSFTCNTTNSVLSSVNFVVGYSDGSFAPALPPLFINGITIAGQLGTTYAFPFDGNQSLLPIQDQASRSTYFVWNFRAACALQLPRSRLLAENTMDWSVRLAGNPVTNEIVVDILEGAAQPLQFTLANERGYVVERRTVSPVQYLNRVVFDVHEQPAGLLLLHITSGQRTQVLKVLKR